MTNMTRQLIIVIFLFPAFSSFSQNVKSKEKEEPIDKVLRLCLDSSQNYTTSGMIGCEARARNLWDQELNKYYKLLMQRLSNGEKENLKTSQKNWIVYRDSEIGFLNNMYDNMQGTMWRMASVSAELELIKHRTLELRGYYSDKKPR